LIDLLPCWIVFAETRSDSNKSKRYVRLKADAKKIPLADYDDNSCVNELEKEGFFKKLTQ